MLFVDAIVIAVVALITASVSVNVKLSRLACRICFLAIASDQEFQHYPLQFG